MTSPEPCRYDSDPEALAWARARVEARLDRLDSLVARAVATGTDNERWRGAGHAGQYLRRALVGDGCVYGAFDERLPTTPAAAEDPQEVSW